MKFSVSLWMALGAFMPTSSGRGDVRRSLQGESIAEDFNVEVNGCSVNARGSLQVNTVMSAAIKQILADGTKKRIKEYNAGFPGGSSATVADPDMCLAEWDRMEQPVGILAKAMGEGTFKWCLPELAIGSPDANYVAVAEEDNPLQGISTGDYWGVWIDTSNSITIAMSKILHRPLSAEFVLVPNVNGWMDDLTEALTNGDCYAVPDIFFRTPPREQVFDYTCFTLGASKLGYGAQSLATIDISSIIANQGDGFTICGVPGSLQAGLLERSFPNATLVEVASVPDMTRGVCEGVCDVVVDDLDNFERFSAS
ncbi:expressed unknown protein (Partial), partial [Seminavis robusta]|eukprot:Sro973_g226670.1 n/a (310) ;mRNA; r:2-931